MTIEAEREHEHERVFTPDEAAASAARRANTGADLATIAIAAALAAFLFGIVAMVLAARDRGSGQAAEAAPAVAVRLTDFKIEAETTTFEAGPVRLALTNAGPSVHNLVVDGAARSRDLKAGERQTLSLGTLGEGSYTWYCSLSGHREAGMEGTFTVVAAGTGEAAAAAGGASKGEDWKAVDDAHEKVVNKFLADLTTGGSPQGGQLMAPTRIEAGVPVYELTAKVVQWEVAPGKFMEAWTYNGTVPGPELRPRQGQRFKVRLTNELPESTSIHWHGLEVLDSRQDGVTFVTQDPIRPGETFEYDLTPLNCGSHMYHSHHAADAQVPLGLLGALNVECTTTPVPESYAHDSEKTLILTDGPLGFGINGKGFPSTSPIVAKRGERTLIRFMNEGLIIHPMHLHGHRMTVVAKDGWFLDDPFEVDTLNVAPGERYDVIVESRYPGVWAFHCHILTHAESPEGLHGMTTVWVVQ